MGSSGEASEKGIDPSVGGLVWVRRRNGSWWPGRILGLDEVSESCVVSPRSGTPVKLLGREDASVDWYNLEKSKRVKAFRCGEYDDCIAKAKASAANSSKKAVKYARREDAIIHALEIENSRLGKADADIVGVGPRDDSLGRENGTSVGESPSVSRSGSQKTDDGDDDDVSDSEKNPDSPREFSLSRSGISFEDPNHISSSKVQSVQGRQRTPNDSEDDGTEGVKRMRGLEDLGVGVASKRKVQAGALLELVKLDNASLPDSNNHANSLPNGNGTTNGTRGGSSLKRKRTPVTNNAGESLKRKDRRRPLTKVLESTAMVAVPVVCGDGEFSRLESAELKRSCSPTVKDGSDCNGVLEESGAGDSSAMEPASDTSHVNDVSKENGVFNTHGSAENGSSDGLCDVPFVGEQKQSAGSSVLVAQSPSDIPQSRGPKRLSTQAEESLPKNECVKETSEAGHANIGQRLEKSTSKWQSKRKRNSRKTSRNRKQDSRKYSETDDKTDPSLTVGNGIGGAKPKQVSDDPTARGEPGQRLLPHRQSRFTVHSRYRTSDSSRKSFLSSDSVLYEVKVEVKVNDRPRHVPLVSLMSKLTGKAVVGHPVAVEVLEDGFCDRLLSSVEEEQEIGEEEEEDDEEEGDLEGPHVKRVPAKGRGTKHLVLQPKSPKTKKPGLLPKKIRKLSSLTGGKRSEERKVAAVEKRKDPVIACIPLKLVFSRINEAVNGSARQTNRA